MNKTPFYCVRIPTGKRNAPRIVAAIREILEIPEEEESV